MPKLSNKRREQALLEVERMLLEARWYGDEIQALATKYKVSLRTARSWRSAVESRHVEDTPDPETGEVSFIAQLNAAIRRMEHRADKEVSGAPGAVARLHQVLANVLNARQKRSIEIEVTHRVEQSDPAQVAKQIVDAYPRALALLEARGEVIEGEFEVVDGD